jgi:hypothetical protein
MKRNDSVNFVKNDEIFWAFSLKKSGFYWQIAENTSIAAGCCANGGFFCTRTLF